MKQKVLYILLLFVNLNLYSNTKPEYIITNNSYIYDFDYDHYEPIAKLKKGNVIYLENNWFLLFNEMIYVSDGQVEGEIKSDIAIPKNTKDLFDNQLISKPNGDYEWIPIYYLDILQQKNRELLRTYEPDIPDIVDASDYGMDTWIDRFYINGYLKIYNIMIGIGYGNGCTNNMACDLNIINIEKKNNGYDITVANGIAIQNHINDNHSGWLFKKIPKYTDYTTYKIYFRFDGDYLKIYMNDLNNLIQIFFKADKTTQKEIISLVKTEKCDLSNITWPRHADGTCDYDGSGKSSSAKTVSTSTNVAVKKILTTNCNLKLRSGEATSTQVLTVMSAGTKVKILKLGKAETIDGINSNWVKVEVLPGAKDRDGKEIKSGLTGWCYGGYLE